MDQLQKSYLFRFAPRDRVWLLIFGTPQSPTAALAQFSGPLEWLNNTQQTTSHICAAFRVNSCSDHLREAPGDFFIRF